ncbi:hypothetical protein HNO89_004441 [Sporosarcina luteola]|nr:hypothetical protein [Sporosarcina luteola]
MKKLLIGITIPLLLLFACSKEEKETETDIEIETRETALENENNNVSEKIHAKEDDGKDHQEHGKEIEKNEVNAFVEKYNELASLSEGLGSLDATKEIDDGGAQVLFSSKEYGIIAVYEEEILDRYTIVYSKIEPYEEQKGTAFNAMLTIANVLDIDSDRLTKEFKKSLSNESYSYLEENYTIIFLNHKLSGESDFGLIVAFEKK